MKVSASIELGLTGLNSDGWRTIHNTTFRQCVAKRRLEAIRERYNQPWYKVLVHYEHSTSHNPPLVYVVVMFR